MNNDISDMAANALHGNTSEYSTYGTKAVLKMIKPG